MVREPLTDPMRFHVVWGYNFTTAAGEDVRIIPVRGDEWPAELPREDYWLLDSRTLLAMHYEENGTYIGAEPVEEPARVVQANYWRDVAVSISVPYQDYRTRLDASGFHLGSLSDDGRATVAGTSNSATGGAEAIIQAGVQAIFHGTGDRLTEGQASSWNGRGEAVHDPHKPGLHPSRSPSTLGKRPWSRPCTRPVKVQSCLTDVAGSVDGGPDEQPVQLDPNTGERVALPVQFVLC